MKLWVYLSIKIRIETYLSWDWNESNSNLWVYLSIKIRIETETLLLEGLKKMDFESIYPLK